MAEQDGKIIVAGNIEVATNDYFDSYVARFNRDLTPDLTFGENHSGVTIFDFGHTGKSWLRSIAIDPVTQDIVIGGT
ncbi:delta-60 repeat domain-containing protein, partial [Klebsiella pneumoniae]|nr:delta-60 repeat domain-containing protein [Klebsiella pneumoniae]